MALDDATLRNGCMHFVPQSHRRIQAKHDRTGKYDEVVIGTNMNEVSVVVGESVCVCVCE